MTNHVALDSGEVLDEGLNRAIKSYDNSNDCAKPDLKQHIVLNRIGHKYVF